MNSFLSIYLFYFIIVYFGNFRGGKNRGSMDLVHDGGSMDPVHISLDPVHGPSPRRGSMDPWSMFCTFPFGFDRMNSRSKQTSIELTRYRLECGYSSKHSSAQINLLLSSLSRKWTRKLGQGKSLLL